MPGKRIYFEGLDGLRFISISFVVLHHLFTFAAYFGTVSVDAPVVGLIGYYGIQFFFAGSGFLITYLLLAEHERTGRIDIGRFFLRRILRIWPAYYVLVLLALLLLLYLPFFFIPDVTDRYLAADTERANLLYFTFLPHIAGQQYPTAPYIHQTYTIGIEEQFYFIWGFVFLFFARRAWYVFVVILAGVFLLNVCRGLDWLDSFPLIKKIAVFADYCRFSTFAIGALWAWMYFRRPSFFHIFRKPAAQIAVYLILIVSITLNVSVPFFRDEYISIVMLLLFTTASFADTSLIRFDAKWLRFLGKISYGIYLFHIIAIVLAVKAVGFLGANMAPVLTISILVLLAMALSILFGWLSYVSVEAFFLRIKKRLARVDHGGV